MRCDVSARNAQLIHEVISRQEASDFLRAIEITLAHMTRTQVEEVYLYVERRNALAISFDSEWQAFLGYTRGYNQPENRTPLRGGGHVLGLVRSRLRARPHNVAGGRVFFASERAFRVNEDHTEDTLCWWIWLGNTLNLVDDVLHLLRQAKFR